MNIHVEFITARSATIILDDNGLYTNDTFYDIYLNEKYIQSTQQVVINLYDLKPHTMYHFCVKQNDTLIWETSFETKQEEYTLNVKHFGAYGDGLHDDTKAIQAAIMSCPKNSRVLIEEGTYKISSLYLKSNLCMEIQKGATLIAYHDREYYAKLPGLIDSYDDTTPLVLGTWEGNPLDTFTSILYGYEVENVCIYGEGVIDGDADFDNWWHDVRTMVGAFRPRMFFISHSKNVTLQGLTFKNSPSWTLHPYFSENLGFYGTTIINPKDSHNTDGLDPESCKNVKIYGLSFDLGDDCIAIKSGKIFSAKTFHTPSSHIEVKYCLMQNGHGAVTVGSEIAGGVHDVMVSNCAFNHTDRGLRIKTRRGRGKDSILDGIIFKNIYMDKVLTPFVVNSFYFCDPDGKSEYVQNQMEMPVDDRTPSIGSLLFDNIKAVDAQYCAGYFHGLPEKKIACISCTNVSVSFDPNAEKGTAAMMCNLDDMCRRGFTFKNVEKVVLNHVQIENADGEDILQENVDEVEQCK